MDIPVHLRALKPAMENALVVFGVQSKQNQNEKTNQKTEPQQEDDFKSQ